METKKISLNRRSVVDFNTVTDVSYPLPIFLTECRARRHFKYPDQRLVTGLIYQVEGGSAVVDAIPELESVDQLTIITRETPIGTELMGVLVSERDDTLPTSTLQVKFKPLGKQHHFLKLFLDNPNMSREIYPGLSVRNFNMRYMTADIFGDSLVLDCMVEPTLTVVMKLDDDGEFTTNGGYLDITVDGFRDGYHYDEERNLMLATKELFLKPRKYAMAVDEDTQKQILELFDSHQYYASRRYFDNGVCTCHAIEFDVLKSLPGIYHIHTYGVDRSVSHTLNLKALPPSIRNYF